MGRFLYVWYQRWRTTSCWTEDEVTRVPGYRRLDALQWTRSRVAVERRDRQRGLQRRVSPVGPATPRHACADNLEKKGVRAVASPPPAQHRDEPASAPPPASHLHQARHNRYAPLQRPQTQRGTTPARRAGPLTSSHSPLSLPVQVMEVSVNQASRQLCSGASSSRTGIRRLRTRTRPTCA